MYTVRPLELDQFHSSVQQTITTLPEKFREKLENVAIVVEDRPRSGSRNLLGLYEGVPVTAWAPEYSGKLPDKISLFKENIEAYARGDEEVPHVIRETLLHEIAHHFGFEHDKIGEMERRWREERK